jgi:hypothetical protein
LSFQRAFPFVTLGCIALTAACGSTPDGNLFENHGNVDAAFQGFGGSGTSSNGGAPGSGSTTSNGGVIGGGGLSGNGGEPGSGGAQGGRGSVIDGGSGGAHADAGAGGSGNQEAGAGGSAGASGAGGVIATGGAAGAGGVVASGGAAGAGGVVASGGAAGANGSGGAAGNPGAGFVRCGDGSCDKSKGLSCCVRTVAQKTTATCTKDTSLCDNVFVCDGDADCASGKHCCLDYNNTQSAVVPDTACLSTCSSGPFQCGGPADCPGQECCGNGVSVKILGTIIGTTYSSVVCQDSCVAATAMVSYELCDKTTVCAQNNTTCLPSASFPPGYSVCK